MAQYGSRSNLFTCKRLIESYITQLFGHLGDEVVASRYIKDPYDWVDKTRSSYELWLSYAMVDIFNTPTANDGIRVVNWKPAQTTTEDMKVLEGATSELIQEYIDWAVPPETAMLWRRSSGVKQFVSPVHLSFFCKCRRNTVARPFFPRTPHEIFLHPIFLTVNPHYRASLVVPEYFLGTPANFDRATNTITTTYYIFPNLAQRLFEYVKQAKNNEVPPFGEFYKERENSWLVHAGSDHELASPDPILKRHWRWAEVLRMLWDVRGSARRQSPPRWCLINQLWTDDRKGKLFPYLNSFGNMAIVWYVMWSPRG